MVLPGYDDMGLRMDISEYGLSMSAHTMDAYLYSPERAVSHAVFVFFFGERVIAINRVHAATKTMAAPGGKAR